MPPSANPERALRTPGPPHAGLSARNSEGRRLRVSLAGVLGSLAAAFLAARVRALVPVAGHDPVPAQPRHYREADAAARAAFASRADWQELVAEAGGVLRLHVDARTGALGYAKLRLPLLPGSGNDLAAADPALADLFARDAEAATTAATRSFFAAHASVLGLDPSDLDFAAERITILLDGNLIDVDVPIRPQGVPMDGARAYLRLVRGNLVEVGGVDLAPAGAASAVPSVDLATARGRILDLLPSGWPDWRDEGSLVWLPVERQGRLIAVLTWRFQLTLDGGVELWTGHVDTRDGMVLDLADRTQYACPPPPAKGQVRGGVFPIYPFLPEQVRETPFGQVAFGASNLTPDLAGLYAYPGGTGNATLTGPNANILCGLCTNPTNNLATTNAQGDADFGTGGHDTAGNGTSQPGERTAFYAVNHDHELTRKWLPAADVPAPMDVHVNVQGFGNCNGAYNGSIHLLPEGGGCVNTAESPGVTEHEWGHGLDAQNNGISGDWSEGCADHLDWLSNRYDSVAPGFYLGNPDGIRIMNEDRAPTLRVWPAPECGGETHCLGEVIGQADWHLVRLFRTDPRFGEETGWHLGEAVFFLSVPAVENIEADVPSSAYEGYANTLDALFGDGNLGNGVPLATLLNAAYTHHGICSATPYTEQGYPCASPPHSPAPSVLYEPRASATGRPRVTLTWMDAFGGVAFDVLRSEEGAAHSKLKIAQVPAGTSTYVDDQLVLGVPVDYCLQPHLATKCYAIMDVDTPVPVHPGLGLQVVVVDEAGDGVWSSGEQVDVRPIVRNLTGSFYPPAVAATGVVATLLPGDPRVTLVQPTALIGDIAGNSIRTGPTWTVALANDPTLCGQTLTFPVRLTSNEGCWDATWAVVIGGDAPQVVLSSTRVDDPLPAGNANTLLEPGETVNLFPTLRNMAASTAPGVTATLATTSPDITILDGSGGWGDLAGGASAEAVDGFTVSLSPSALCGQTVPFTLTVSSRGGCLTTTLPFSIVAAPTTHVVVLEEFEDPRTSAAWTVSGTATQGAWRRTNPLAIVSAGGVQVAPSADTTPAPGHFAFVTGGATTQPGLDDVDGGCTTLTSPVWPLAGDPGTQLLYTRWFGWAPEPAAGAAPDTLTVEASGDGGLSWVPVETVSAAAAAWQAQSFNVGTLFGGPVPATLSLRFTACDVDADSLVEAAVDDVQVTEPVCAPPGPLPSLVAVSWTFDDTAGGNGNGIPEAGETIAVTVRARNVGNSDARNITGVLSLQAPVTGVTLPVDTSPYPDLASLIEGDNGVTFQVALDASTFPCGADVPLGINWTYTGDGGPGAASDAHVMTASPRIPDTGETAALAEDFESGALATFSHYALAGEDDWQVGAPAGTSGDPTAAVSGTQVAGNDLGIPQDGLARDGAIAGPAQNRLESAPLDLSRFADVHLRFQRFLGVSSQDHARVLVNGAVVWENPPGTGVTDTAWTPVDLDITAQAAGQTSVVIDFESETTGGAVAGGWTLDDVSVAGHLLVPSCACVAPPADPIGPALRVRRQANAAILDWSLYSGNGAAFRVYRDSLPSRLSPAISVPLTADALPRVPWLEPDPTTVTTALTCYVVRALDACGNEEP